MEHELSWHQRLLSYLYPVKIAKAATQQNAVLELYYHRGQYQLATYDALYSDGSRYRPLRLAIRYLHKRKAIGDSVLVLGTGLGSVVHILYGFGYSPTYTLVEADATILQWAIDTLPKAVATEAIPIHEDAEQYMATNSQQYSLVVVDIFNSRVVPAFVTSQVFLLSCKAALADGGVLVLNYIVINKDAWQAARHCIETTFSKCEILEDGMNRIVIATA